MKINFISSKDSEVTHAVYTKTRNIEIIMGNKTDEIIEKLFESLLQNYQKDLEEPMREEVNLFLMVLVYCITTFKKRFEKR